MTESEEDDEPVLGPPRICADCGKKNIPLAEVNSDLVCDHCYESRIAFGRLHCGEFVDGAQEITLEYHVKITVKARDLSKAQLVLARLRGIEILLGIPLADDEESWEHELIAMTDAEGNEVPDE